MLRISSNVLFAVAAILFAAAIGAYFYESDAPGGIVDEPNRDFPALAIGKNEVSFRFHNPTGHPIRVVGYQFC